MARKKFPSAGCTLGAVEKLIDYCEEQLEHDRRTGSSTLPKLTKEERHIEKLQQAYGTLTIRKKPSFRGNDYFLDYHRYSEYRKGMGKSVQPSQDKTRSKSKSMKMETGQSPYTYQ